jgi:hypothetical protein
MKKIVIFVIGMIVIGMVLLWWHSKKNAPEEQLPKTAQVSNGLAAQGGGQSTTAAPQIQQRTTQNEQLSLYTSNGEALSAEEYAAKQYNKPIEFYGKVVDQDQQPVSGASIGFEWSNAKGEPQTSSAISDSFGLFSISKIKGKWLNINVSKSGYYSSKNDQSGFDYYPYDQKVHHPNSFDPIIFHLYKKGQGVSLLTSQYGIKSDFEVLVPRDGSSVHVDLLQRKTDSSADLEISQIKPDVAHLNSATNWSFHMGFSDGGFVETGDAFLFTAPETGYQSAVDLDFEKGSMNWTTQFSRDFYIMFGQPPKYGWLHVDANIAQQTIVLKYAINPTGSRNLEPK